MFVACFLVLTASCSLDNLHLETVKMSMGGPPLLLHTYSLHHSYPEKHLLISASARPLSVLPQTHSRSHRNLLYVVMVELLPASRAANVLSNGL